MKRFASLFTSPFTSLSAAALAGTLAFSLALPTSAYAQKKAGKANKKEKVRQYDFTGDEIDGDLVKPDGEFLNTRKFAKHTTLIRIRQDFIKEILKSAEDL